MSGDAEVFSSPASFLEGLTPEAARHFERIDLNADDRGIAASVSFIRQPTRHEGVELTVHATDMTRRDDVTSAARAIALSVQRGLRRYVGTSSGSVNLDGRFIGRGVFGAQAVQWLLPVVLGVALALLGITTIDVLFPDANLPTALYTASSIGFGLVYELGFRYLVPNLEITSGGTRLRRVIVRTTITLIGLTVTQLVKLLFAP